jgi:hypothetical protein
MVKNSTKFDWEKHIQHKQAMFEKSFGDEAAIEIYRGMIQFVGGQLLRLERTN